jgi:hypothetical protein
MQYMKHSVWRAVMGEIMNIGGKSEWMQMRVLVALLYGSFYPVPSLRLAFSKQQQQQQLYTNVSKVCLICLLHVLRCLWLL